MAEPMSMLQLDTIQNMINQFFYYLVEYEVASDIFITPEQLRASSSMSIDSDDDGGIKSWTIYVNSEQMVLEIVNEGFGAYSFTLKLPNWSRVRVGNSPEDYTTSIRSVVLEAYTVKNSACLQNEMKMFVKSELQDEYPTIGYGTLRLLTRIASHYLIELSMLLVPYNPSAADRLRAVLGVKITTRVSEHLALTVTLDAYTFIAVVDNKCSTFESVRMLKDTGVPYKAIVVEIEKSENSSILEAISDMLKRMSKEIK